MATYTLTVDSSNCSITKNSFDGTTNADQYFNLNGIGLDCNDPDDSLKYYAPYISLYAVDTTDTTKSYIIALGELDDEEDTGIALIGSSCRMVNKLTSSSSSYNMTTLYYVGYGGGGMVGTVIPAGTYFLAWNLSMPVDGEGSRTQSNTDIEFTGSKIPVYGSTYSSDTSNYITFTKAGEEDPEIEDIELSGFTGEYDGQAHGITLAGFLNTDTITYSEDGTNYSSTYPEYTEPSTNTVYVKIQRDGYQDWTGSATVKITKKKLSIKSSNPTTIDKTYDGTTTATATVGEVDGLISGDSLGGAYLQLIGSGSFSSPDVDSAYDDDEGYEDVPIIYTLIGSGSSYYDPPDSETINARINPRQLTFTTAPATSTTKVYDGTPYSESNTDYTSSIGNIVSIDNVQDDVTVTSSYSSSGSSSKNVGTYTGARTFALSGNAANNYRAPISQTVTSTITQKQLTVTGTTVADKDYDGTTTATATLGTVDGIMSGDDVEVKCTSQFPTADYGTQTVTLNYSIEGDDMGNYYVNNGSTTATINAKDITFVITFADPVIGTEITPTITAHDSSNNTVTGLSPTISWAVISSGESADDATYTPASTYTPKNDDKGKYLVCMASISGNYTGSDTATSSSVIKKPLSGVTLDATGDVIARSTAADTTAITATVAPNGVVAGTDVTYKWYKGASANSCTTEINNANDASYKPTYDDRGNYLKCEVTGIGEYTGTVSAVTSSPVYYKLDTPTLTFSDVTNNSMNVNIGTVTYATSYVLQEWITNVSSEWTNVSGASAGSNARSSLPSATSCKYKVTAKGSSADYIKDSDVSSETTQVTQSDYVDIKANDDGSTSPASVAYGGTFGVSGVTLENIGNTAASNISIAFYASTDSTVTSSDILLGSTTVSSLAAGAVSDSIGISDISTSDKGLNVGTYYIGWIASVTGEGVNPNDNNASVLDNNTGVCATTLQVVSATIGVSVTNYSAKYDGTAHSATLSGADGCTVTYSTDGGASYSSTAVTRKDVGTTNYKIKVTKTNYGEEVVDASITIQKKTLTTTLTGNDKVYDGKTSGSGSIALTGIVSGETVTASGTWAFENKNVGSSKTLNCTGITLSGSDSGNYELSSTSASTTSAITKASLTLTGYGASNKTYDGTVAATITTGTITGIKSNDNDVTDTVTITAAGTFTNKNAGENKSVTITYTLSGTDASNYETPSNGNTTATISQKQLTVTGTTVSDKTYDGTTTATVTNNGTLEGVVSGDEASVSIASVTATFTDSAAGTHDVTLIYTLTDNSDK